MGKKIAFVNSMRGKLLLVFLSLSLIPLIIVSVFAFFQSQNALRAEITDQLQKAANNNSANIIDWLESRKKDLVVMSNNARIQSMEAESAKTAIDQFYSGWGRYETMFVVDTSGKSIATTDNSQVDLSERQYVKDALAGNVVISEPVVSKATGNLVLAIASPVKKMEKLLVWLSLVSLQLTSQN